MHEKIAVIDLFSGAGGTTTGVERVKMFGKKVAKVIACVNHDATAIKSHRANHKGVLHFTEDIRTLNLDRLLKLTQKYKEQKYRVCIWASLECFVAGTLILTKRGNIPIEQVQIGDYVLTHKNRWRRVTSTMEKRSKTVKIKGHGFGEIETTPEHPFYTNEVKNVWNNPRRARERKLQNPQWNPIEIFKNKKNIVLSSPKYFGETIPKVVKGRGFDFSNDFWWFVGRWLGDGSVSNWGDNKQITLCCGKHEQEELTQKLNKFLPKNKRASKSEIRFYKRETRTAYLFDAFHQGLADWLENNFGKYAYGKTIPGWVLGMKKEWRKAILDGYTSADGSFNGKKYQCTSVSKQLALGVKMIAQSLGYLVNFHEIPARNNPIEGRAVICLPQFMVTWLISPEKTSFLQDENHIWGRIRSYSETNEIKNVYNISVADDESYVANGIVVHNCTNFSNAKGGQPRDADSRTLAEHLHRYIDGVDPDYVFIENVMEFMSWGPLNEHGKPVSKDKGKDYVKWINSIKKKGYLHDWRKLDSADFGAHTSRKRYFGVFGKVGLPISFPTPTHAKDPSKSNTLFSTKPLKKWKPVKEVLDLEDEGSSIFGRKKDLSEKTLSRIHAGLIKYVAGGKDAFILKYNSTNKNGHHSPPSVDEPCPVIACQNRLGIVNANFLTKYHGTGENILGMNDTCSTITTKDRLAKVSINTTKQFIDKQFSQGGQHQSIDSPAGALTTVPKMNLVTSKPFLMATHFNNIGSSLDSPAPVITANRKHNYIVNPSWFGHSQSVENPSCTIVARQDKAPIYLITAPEGKFNIPIYDTDSEMMIKIKEFMVLYDIVDIKMRMLKVKELLKIQGFPDKYVLKGNQSQQKKFIGNSVVPLVAELLIKEIYKGLCDYNQLNKTAA